MFERELLTRVLFIDNCTEKSAASLETFECLTAPWVLYFLLSIIYEGVFCVQESRLMLRFGRMCIFSLSLDIEEGNLFLMAIGSCIHLLETIFILTRDTNLSLDTATRVYIGGRMFPSDGWSSFRSYQFLTWTDWERDWLHVRWREIVWKANVSVAESMPCIILGMEAVSLLAERASFCSREVSCYPIGVRVFTGLLEACT